MTAKSVRRTTHERCAHRTYRLTCGEFDALTIRAGGCCEICGGSFPRLDIDHDHAIGKRAVRGLLCHPCNLKMRYVDRGQVEPSPAILTYLASAWHLKGRSADMPTFTDKPAVIIAHIKAIRASVEQRRLAVQAADEVLRNECAQTVTAGVPIAAVARAAGVTRVTMYAWLKEAT